MNRTGLNPQEASLFSMLVTCDPDMRERLIERIEPTSRPVISSLCVRFDALDEDARAASLRAWAVQDAQHHDERHRLATLEPARVQLHQSYLEPRWSRALQLVVHADDPLVPRLPSPYTLSLCARLLCEDLHITHPRPDLLPDEHDTRFDLAHFYAWSPQEFIALSERLGYMMFSCSLMRQDRRAAARQLHALSDEARRVVMHDMKADFQCDEPLVKRSEEVLIALRKRQYASIDEMITSLGLYLLAIAAGRRLATRALELADRLPQPFGADMHGFVRQHRTSSRRGLEPLAARAVELILDHLAHSSGEPS